MPRDEPDRPRYIESHDLADWLTTFVDREHAKRERCPSCGATWGDGYYEPLCECPQPPRITTPISDDDLPF